MSRALRIVRVTQSVNGIRKALEKYVPVAENATDALARSRVVLKGLIDDSDEGEIPLSSTGNPSLAVAYGNAVIEVHKQFEKLLEYGMSLLGAASAGGSEGLLRTLEASDDVDIEIKSMETMAEFIVQVGQAMEVLTINLGIAVTGIEKGL